MKRNVIILALSFCLMLSVGFSGIAFGETVYCPGMIDTMNIFDENVIVTSWFGFRNYNDDVTITINRIVIYDGDGNVRCDFPNIDNFPPIESGFKSTLSPHQTSSLGLTQMRDCKNGINPQNGGYIHAVIDWSFSGKTGKQPLAAGGSVSHFNTTNRYMIDSVPYSCNASAK